MAPTLESLFNAAQLRVYIPRSEVPPEQPTDQPVAGPSRSPPSETLNLAEANQRDRCFYDEEIEYFCQLDLESQAAGFAGIAFSRFSELVRQLDVSVSCSLVPSSAQRQTDGRPRSTGGSAKASSSITAGTGRTHELPSRQSSLTIPTSLSNPPQTPNPSPMTSERDSAYAQVSGQMVWEGVPACNGDKRPALSESGGSFTARWRGVIPVHYVETQIRRPLLAVTASLTRRERGPAIIASPATSVGTPIPGKSIEEGQQSVTLSSLNNDDVLHGLAGAALPRRRITSIQSSVLAGRDVLNTSISTVTPVEAQSAEVSRKSFRVLLALSTAIHVRMRPIPTSPAVQCLPRMICIEISVDEMEPVDFEVEAITVETGGKTNIRSLTTLGQASDFPFDVVRSQIHELVYTMQRSLHVESVNHTSIRHSLESHGTQTISIKVKGRPYQRPDSINPGSRVYIAPAFESRWNCILDASDPATARTAMAENRVRSTKVDRINVPSSASMNRLSQFAAESAESSEIVISLSLLPHGERELGGNKRHANEMTTVKPFEPFWVEATVLNSSKQSQSLALEIPERRTVGPRGPTLPAQGGGLCMSDNEIQDRLAMYLHSDMALVHLENHIPTGILPPRTCQVVRMRFIATRPGLHTIEELVIRGIDGVRSILLKDVLHVLAI